MSLQEHVAGKPIEKFSPVAITYQVYKTCQLLGIDTDSSDITSLKQTPKYEEQWQKVWDCYCDKNKPGE